MPNVAPKQEVTKQVDPKELEETTLPTSLKILLYGESGSGKSAVAATLGNVEEIEHIFYFAIESNAVPGLELGFELHNISEEKRKKFHIMRVPPSNRKVASLLSNAKMVLQTPQDDLLKKKDLQRVKYTRYVEIIKGMQSFIDIHGKDWGTIDSWGENVVVYIDGITVLMEAIRQTIIGGAVALSQPNRGVMQDMFMNYIRFLTEDLRCHVVVLGHPVRQTNDITKVERIFIESGGQALKDKLPAAFNNVVFAYKKSGKYLWSTDHPQAVTAGRNIVSATDMPQDFTQFNWVTTS